MPARTPWLADEERLLGTMSDQDLAQRLGRTRQAVNGRRRELHIPVFQSRRRHWTHAEEELLGTMPDRRFARKFNRTLHSVVVRRSEKRIPLLKGKIKHRWTPDDEKLLGARPDAQIALFLGLSKLAVSRHRRRLGIPRRP